MDEEPQTGGSKVDPGATAVLSRLSPEVSGALWIVTSTICFVAMGVMLRTLARELPLASVVFFRGVVGLALVAAWILVRGRPGSFVTRRARFHFARACCGVISLFAMMEAYRRLDFALASTLAYTTPLWVVATSIAMLGESPGRARLLATAAGFVGVVVMVRPLPASDAGVLFALASGLFGAFSLSFVRSLTGRERIETVVFYFFLFSTVLSAPMALAAGFVPQGAALLGIAAVGLTGALGMACAAQAYQRAEATIVAPFDFLRLPIVVLVGLIWFGETPDPWLIGGGAIIVCALYAVVVTTPASSATKPILASREK